MDIMGFGQIVSQSCMEYYASCKNSDNDNVNDAANGAGGKQPDRNWHLQ